MIAVAVGVAGGIEPRDRHAFAIAGGSEQSIHDFLICAGTGVPGESLHFLGSRWEAGQIVADAAKPARFVGFAGGFDAFLFQLGEDEGIEPVADPFLVFDLGLRDGVREGNEGPVRLVFGTLLDPFLKEFLLTRGQRSDGFGRGHNLIGIGAVDALIDRALGQVARNDGADVLFAVFGEGLLRDVQTKIGFARVFIGAVTAKATVGKDGADVAVELDFIGRAGGLHPDAGQRRQQKTQRAKQFQA